MIPKNIQNSIWFNLLLLVLTVVLSAAAFRGIKQAIDFKEESAEEKEKIAELLKQKENLEQKIAELETTEARERVAKDRLNLKKVGEEVVVVLPEDKATSTLAKGSWWNRLFKKLTPY